jgi:hypothetical protein
MGNGVVSSVAKQNGDYFIGGFETKLQIMGFFARGFTPK